MTEKPDEIQGPGRGPNPLAYVGVGFELVVPIILGVLGGLYLDRRWDTTPWWVVTGALAGIAAGFYNFFRAVLPAARGRNDGDSG